MKKHSYFKTIEGPFFCIHPVHNRMSKNQRALLGGPKCVLNEQESKSIVRRSKICA